MRLFSVLVVLALCSGCVNDPPLKVRSDTHAVATDDGWPVSLPQDQAMDPDLLDIAYDTFFADEPYYNAISLIIARNGVLVGEAYARGAGDRVVKRNIQSATKSIASMVFGIAMDDGWFTDLDQTLYSIIPADFDSDLRKRTITLRHLLTMRSGIDFSNDDFSRELLMDRPTGQAAIILSKPLYGLPGTAFRYRDADPQLLASAIVAVTGDEVAAIAASRLFAPLGIKDWFWEKNADGTTLGGVSVSLRPRDLAKLGQLALQEGAWGGEQLVPQAWMQQATTFQTESDYEATPYGYYWWIVPELQAYTAWGHGGNFIFVVPGKQLVVVLTSFPSADDDDVGTTLAEFIPLVKLIARAAN